MNRSPSFWLHLTIERHPGQTQSGAHLWQVFHARWGQTFHARWGQAFHAHWADLRRDSAVGQAARLPYSHAQVLRQKFPKHN